MEKLEGKEMGGSKKPKQRDGKVFWLVFPHVPGQILALVRNVLAEAMTLWRPIVSGLFGFEFSIKLGFSRSDLGLAQILEKVRPK